MVEGGGDGEREAKGDGEAAPEPLALALPGSVTDARGLAEAGGDCDASIEAEGKSDTVAIALRVDISVGSVGVGLAVAHGDGDGVGGGEGELNADVARGPVAVALPGAVGVASVDAEKLLLGDAHSDAVGLAAAVAEAVEASLALAKGEADGKGEGDACAVAETLDVDEKRAGAVSLAERVGKKTDEEAAGDALTLAVLLGLGAVEVEPLAKSDAEALPAPLLECEKEAPAEELGDGRGVPLGCTEAEEDCVAEARAEPLPERDAEAHAEGEIETPRESVVEALGERGGEGVLAEECEGKGEVLANGDAEPAGEFEREEPGEWDALACGDTDESTEAVIDASRVPPADCVAKGGENEAGGESLGLAELLVLIAPEEVPVAESGAEPLAAALAECRDDAPAD